jgi:predicted DNA-binding protein (MmcQ/YjbR family)
MAKADPLNRLRKIVLALPNVIEKEAWGEPTFRAPGGMFVMYANNHHNDGRVAIWCKAPLGYQAEKIGIAPERFFSPPYMGVSGWVGLRLDVDVDWDEVASVVAQAYEISREKTKSRRSTQRAAGRIQKSR